MWPRLIFHKANIFSHKNATTLTKLRRKRIEILYRQKIKNK